MPRKKSRRLTQAEKAEALLLAEEMLCSRVQEPVIVEALLEQFPGISKAVGKRIARQALKEMVEAVQEQAPHRRAQQLASLDRLYEKALTAGKYGAAVGVQRLIAKLEGNEKPKPKPWDKPKPEVGAKGPVDEFEGRSEEDCDYYAEHGHFPEEAPGAADDDNAEASADPVFPLH
jgi:hypothetical protein